MSPGAAFGDPRRAPALPRLAVSRFCAESARGLVEGQRLLDEQARASLIRWEEDGLPPTAWTWARMRLDFPAQFQCWAKAGPGGTTGLAIASTGRAAGRVVLTLRYQPTPQA